MPQVSVSRDGQTDTLIELRDVDVTIGRDPSNDVCLVDPTQWVSRYHAVIRRGPSGYTMEDLGSLNGLQVAGQQVRRVALTSGTRVVIGPYAIDYVDGPARPTDPGTLGTVLDPNVGRRSATPVASGPPRVKPLPLPIPRRTKGEKQAIVFGVTLLIVVAIWVLMKALTPS